MPIFVAERPPGQCSVCLTGHDPARTYVDFGIEWDGPVIPQEGGDGYPKHLIEDLIVCDRCLQQAFDAVDFSPQERRRLELERDEARKTAAEQTAYAKSLEQTLAVKPRSEGRSSRQAVPEQLRELVAQRVRGEGVSVAQAAKEAGVSEQSVYNWLKAAA